ncbi:unnamed protein product, partial [marine sediment metagenome]
PYSYDYGNVEAGQCSATYSFTLQNTGGGTATGSVSLTGTNANQFTITSGDGSFSLGAGATKTINVKFCPTSEGGKSATLYADGSNCNDDSSYLLGTGVVEGALTVTTNDATNITTKSATLNGNLDNRGTASTVYVSFEYGLTTAYGSETTPQAMTTTGPFSFPLTGLSPNTTYHVRAKAVGGSTSYGLDKSFTTSQSGAVELSYDDGSAEFGFMASQNGLGAVLFDAIPSMKITKLKFYTWGDMIPVEVCILSSSQDIIFSQVVTPSPGWYEVDVSQENILT